MNLSKKIFLLSIFLLGGMSIQHVGALEIENYKNSITQVTAKKILIQIEKIPSEIKKTDKYKADEAKIRQKLQELDATKKGLARKRSSTLITSYQILGKYKKEARNISREVPKVPTPPLPQISTPVVTSTPPQIKSEQDTTYYNDLFQGRTTASGDMFLQQNYSAASCVHPFGTLLQVQHKETTIVAKVNDRPNCKTNSGVLDLSSRTFSSIAPLSAGRIRTNIQVIGEVPRGVQKYEIPQDFFSGLGVQLVEGVPSILRKNSTLRIRGVSQDQTSLCLVVDPSGKRYVQSNENGKEFSCSFPLRKTGEYLFVVASGNKIENTSNIGKVVVIEDRDEIIESTLPVSKDLSKIDYTIEAGEIINQKDDQFIRMVMSDSNLFYTVEVQQGQQRVISRGKGEASFALSDFVAFQAKEKVVLTIYGQKINTPFDLNVQSKKEMLLSENFNLTNISSSSKENGLKVEQTNNKIRVTGSASKDITTQSFLTLPDGSVKIVLLGGEKKTISAGNPIDFTIPLEGEGAYRYEINTTTGFAVLNIPVYNGNYFPALPFVYQSTLEKGNDSIQNIDTRSLNFLNSLRPKEHQLTLDPTLSRAAQLKAEDMQAFNYLGHYDKQGRAIRDFARNKGVDLSGLIGENVAGGNGISFEVLIVSLAQSGGHRMNMLNTSFTKVGIGAVATKNGILYVQVFGE